MRRLLTLLTVVIGLALSLAAVFTWTAGAGSASADQSGCAPPDPCGPIRHIVFMIKENRSFDSMFGRFPRANGARTFRGLDGKLHPLTHQPDSITDDIQHRYLDARTGIDRGKMDGFARLVHAIQNGV